MDSVRYSMLLLQEHMLFIDYYIPLGKYQRWHDIPSLASAPILKHIDQYRRSPEMTSATKETIDQAVLTLLRYKGVLPTPSVPFIDLVHIFTNHMNTVSSGNQVPGKYVIQALCFFFRCDKIEAFIRYVAPLVQYKILRNASTSRPAIRNAQKVSVSELIRVFEDSTFSANPVTSLPQRLPMSTVLPRLTSVFSYLTKKEGESEIMFLSHNLMAFAHNGEEVHPTPISLGPFLLRRYWLGASWFLGQKSLSPQSEVPISTDYCAIVSGDDFQLAVFCLSSTNNPGNLPLRDWAPVFVAVGFPPHIHPTAIQSGIKQVIDALEVRYGPREQLPYQASDFDSTAFRDLCHTIGRTVFDLVNAIFYQPGNPQGELVPRVLLSGSHSPLVPMNSSYISHALSTGYGRKISGLPQLMTDFTGFLTPSFSSQSMSAKSLAAASRILLLAASFAQSTAGFSNNNASSSGAFGEAFASDGFVNVSSPSLAGPSPMLSGGLHPQSISAAASRLACCLFYHGNLVVCDTHPYIARLLWLATYGWHSNNAKRMADAQQSQQAGGALASSVNRSRAPNMPASKSVPVALPLNYLFPKGPFADHSIKPKQSTSDGNNAGGEYSRTNRSGGGPTGPSSSDRSSQPPMEGSSGGPQSPPPQITVKNSILLESYLTTQDCALLWLANRQGPRPVEGWHPTVHLSHSGIDLIMLFHADTTPSGGVHQQGSPLSSQVPVFPTNSNSSPLLGSPSVSSIRNRLLSALPQHAGVLIEEMQILRHSIVKHDVIRKPKAVSSVGGSSKQKRLPETFGFVHNKATASTTFVEGTGGADAAAVAVLGESADGITTANLQRSCQLVSEASSIARLLGAKMHANPSAYFTQSLASKPITRAILGRSSFGDYGDKPGVFNLIYGKETAGQQCVVGSSSVSATVRNSEDQFLLFAGACAKNNIAVV